MALDFTIIGAQRTGTTWVFSRLSMHPNIYFPLGKEANLWNNIEAYRTFNTHMISYYRSRFSSKFMSGSEFKLGDVSPLYAVMPSANIDSLYDTYPRVQAIYILRNPILRIFSARRFSVKNKKPDIDFTTSSMLKLLSSPDPKSHSDYVANIKRWSSSAQKHNSPLVEIMLYSDLLHNPVAFASQLANIVGIDGSYYTRLPSELVREKLNSGAEYDIPLELYAEALKIYAPMVRELEDLIQRDLSGWLDANVCSEYPTLDQSYRRAGGPLEG